MGHFFSKVSLFIDKKEAAAHLILDQDFATAPFFYDINGGKKMNTIKRIIKTTLMFSALIGVTSYSPNTPA